VFGASTLGFVIPSGARKHDPLRHSSPLRAVRSAETVEAEGVESTIIE